uniref:Cytochrome b6-f complex subunit PetP n=1 Tax=Thuretia quercifolia TaxID=189650 RepID=A0A1Z1MKP6_9FLOR|nr:cytochrome b6-f complex subunit PetP [Thuretia quercifolia]ARW66449.1 cytochrome b6-f complex subunit PetP [Thuretia quercifolia]
MTKKILLKSIPTKIKIKIFKYFHFEKYIVGYKITSKNYKLLIIQLKNNIRLWILSHEIKAIKNCT